MFSSYFFVLCFKKVQQYERPAYSAQYKIQNRGGNGLYFRASTPWCTGWFFTLCCTGWFFRMALSLYADIRLAMESYKPNAWFPTSLKFSYCKKNLVWMGMIISCNCQLNTISYHQGGSLSEGLSWFIWSLGLGEGGMGITLMKLIKEKRPDLCGNHIPYAGDSVVAENGLSAGMHVQICSCLLRLCVQSE